MQLQREPSIYYELKLIVIIYVKSTLVAAFIGLGGGGKWHEDGFFAVLPGKILAHWGSCRLLRSYHEVPIYLGSRNGLPLVAVAVVPIHVGQRGELIIHGPAALQAVLLVGRRWLLVEGTLQHLRLGGHGEVRRIAAVVLRSAFLHKQRRGLGNGKALGVHERAGVGLVGAVLVDD